MSAPQRNARSWLLLSAAVIAIDFAVKQWALTALTPHVAVPVVDGLLNWTLTFNPGAAFSLLSEASGWQRWFFSVLAVAVSAVLAWWLGRIERGDWRQALPFALIIGGALGNLVDRLRYGHVVDYIDVYWRDSHWPAFNVADAAIVGGAIAMVLFSFHKPATPPKP